MASCGLDKDNLHGGHGPDEAIPTWRPVLEYDFYVGGKSEHLETIKDLKTLCPAGRINSLAALRNRNSHLWLEYQPFFLYLRKS